MGAFRGNYAKNYLFLESPLVLSASNVAFTFIYRLIL